MANTNTTKKNTTSSTKKATTKTKKTTQPVKETVATEATNVNNTPVNNGPTYDELLSLVQQLAGEVASLKNSNTAQEQPAISQTDSKADKLLDLLANRKSDREITIVHNCEITGGLSTHLELTGMTVDFKALGEQRVLSWQQFEECVSKYRSFFDRQIILLSNEHQDMAERYNIPCVNRGKYVLTHSEVVKLHTLTPSELEKFVEKLTDEDKKFIFSYWIGKCYERELGYYDRHKVELLNHLSGEHVFDNVLTLMNGDYTREDEKK